MPDPNGKGEMPEMVMIDGIQGWMAPSGRFYPLIAGGDGEGAGAGAGTGDQGGDKSDGAGDGEAFDKDRAMATIKKLRENEKAGKAQAKELEEAKAKIAAHEQEKMTEVEKAQAQLKVLQDENTSLKGRVQSAAAESAASRAGAMYPDLVAAKIPSDALDDPKKLEAAIAEIKKQYSALFGKAGGSADGGAGGKPAAGANDWIRQAAAGR